MYLKFWRCILFMEMYRNIVMNHLQYPKFLRTYFIQYSANSFQPIIKQLNAVSCYFMIGCPHDSPLSDLISHQGCKTCSGNLSFLKPVCFNIYILCLMIHYFLVLNLIFNMLCFIFNHFSIFNPKSFAQC